MFSVIFFIIILAICGTTLSAIYYFKSKETKEGRSEKKEKTPPKIQPFASKLIPRLIIVAIICVVVYFIHGWVNEKMETPEEVKNQIGWIEEDAAGYKVEEEFDHKTKKVVRKIKTYTISKGTFVRLLTEREENQIQLSSLSEKLVEVMTMDSHGNFIEGEVFLIPPRNINWEWEKRVTQLKKEEAAQFEAERSRQAEAERRAAQEAAANDLRGEWTLRYKSFSPKKVVIREGGENLVMTSGSVVFKGKKTGEKSYEGEWIANEDQGRFSVKFQNNFFADGNFISNSGRSFPMNLCRE